MLSRVLGLLRDALMAALIGAGPVLDAFVVALRLPSMFRQMFAEGALSASFVPMFADKLHKDGDQKARQFASSVASFFLLTIGSATTLAIIFMEPIVRMIAADIVNFDMAVLLSRITSIYLLCMVLTALISGVLNTKRHFAAGAIAPILFNVCTILGLIISFQFFGVTAEFGGLVLAIAVAIAGFLQVVFVWLVAAQKFHFVLMFPLPKITPDIRRLFGLMIPGLIAAGGLQLNTLIGIKLASANEAGLGYVYLAERLYQLPIGLIAVAFGVAALPQLSGFFANNQRDKAIETITLGVELAFLIAMPASLALIAMPDVIVRLIFEHGATTADDTIIIAGLVSLYALALPALAIQRVYNASFHARKDMRPPMLLTLIGVCFNVVIAVLTFESLGLIAIPIAIAASAWLQAIGSAYWVARKGLWQPTGAQWWRLGGIGSSAIIMAAAVWLAKGYVLNWVADSFFGLIIGTILMIIFGMSVYFLMLVVLRGLAPEAKWILKRAK